MMSEELLTRSNLELLRESGHPDEEFTEEVKVYINHIRQLYQLNQLVAVDKDNETTVTQAREHLENLNNFLSGGHRFEQRYYNFMKDAERIVSSLSGLEIDQAQQILVAQEEDSEQLNMEADNAMSKEERIVNLVSSETAAALANKTAQANIEAKEAPHLGKRLRELDIEEEREITGIVNLVETAAANKMVQANVEAKEAPPLGKRLRKSYHDLFDDYVLPPALLAL